MSAKEHISPEDLLSAPLLAIEQLSKQIGNALVMAPHPDDEVLGCGGLIQLLLNQELTVVVCFATSGNASHLHSRKFPPAKLAQLRESEARKACEILGVPAENVFFLKQPDSLLTKLSTEKNTDISSKIAHILKAFQISSLLLPWRRDPHPDHRASFTLGRSAAEMVSEPVQIVEYPIWLWKNASEADWPEKNEMEIYRLDISSVFEKKEEAIYAHESQTSELIDDDPEGFILTDDLLSPFLTPFEFYLLNKEENIASLSKEYFDSLYANSSDPWNFRSSEYEKEKYKTIDTYLGDRFYDSGLELGCSIGVHTSHLAAHCKRLLAVDISDDAIATAKETNHLSNVDFEIADVTKEFPKGQFDFISLCEMGYYFNESGLLQLFEHIGASLNPGGQFLMVHWTSYVREYPLNGRRVHQLFIEYNLNKKLFFPLSSATEDRYELVLWEKRK